MQPILINDPAFRMEDSSSAAHDRRTIDIDAGVIARCREGDLAAFEEVYHSLRRPLYTLAWRFHGNHADAEDSMQEAFIAMYRGIRSFRGEARFSTWATRVVLNTCMSRRRRRSSDEQRTDYRDEHAQPAADADDGDALLRAHLGREVARLPELQRAVFLLHAADGCTHQEIAETLGIREGTSKSYLHRARETLKRRLTALGITSSELAS